MPYLWGEEKYWSLTFPLHIFKTPHGIEWDQVKSIKCVKCGGCLSVSVQWKLATGILCSLRVGGHTEASEAGKDMGSLVNSLNESFFRIHVIFLCQCISPWSQECKGHKALFGGPGHGLEFASAESLLPLCERGWGTLFIRWWRQGEESAGEKAQL